VHVDQSADALDGIGISLWTCTAVLAYLFPNLALPDAGRAAILEEMEFMREHGTSVARLLRQDIYEVHATYNTKAYRILFACEGRFQHVLLALDGFRKKDAANTQNSHQASRTKTSRLATTRESKASRSGKRKESLNGTGFS
jgi:phage-related protein